MSDDLYSYMNLGINHHLLNFGCFENHNYHLENALPPIIVPPQELEFQVTEPHGISSVFAVLPCSTPLNPSSQLSRGIFLVIKGVTSIFFPAIIESALSQLV